MKNEKIENTSEMNLIDFWYIILKHIWFIIIFTLTITSLTMVYVFLILTPSYISRADVMIQVEQDSSTSNNPDFDLVNAFRLIDTVAELMEKEIILENALARLTELGYENLSISYIREGLIVSSSSSSYFINISFVDEDEKFSEEAVNAVIDAVIEETDVEDAFPVLTNKIRRTSYASDAVYFSPNKLVSTILGFVTGLITSVGFVTFKETFSTYFKNKDEIESALNIQVLSVIPKMNYKEKNNEKK